MYVIAWIGIIISILNLIIAFISTFTKEKISDRITNFLGVGIHSSLVYFFIKYLFI